MFAKVLCIFRIAFVYIHIYVFEDFFFQQRFFQICMHVCECDALDSVCYLWNLLKPFLVLKVCLCKYLNICRQVPCTELGEKNLVEDHTFTITLSRMPFFSVIHILLVMCTDRSSYSAIVRTVSVGFCSQPMSSLLPFTAGDDPCVSEK